MWTLLFFVMFFGLLASGMPIFLVLGACAAVLFFFSDQPGRLTTQQNTATLGLLWWFGKEGTW